MRVNSSKTYPRGGFLGVSGQHTVSVGSASISTISFFKFLKINFIITGV